MVGVVQGVKGGAQDVELVVGMYTNGFKIEKVTNFGS
jgi:hypothetical protein